MRDGVWRGSDVRCRLLNAEWPGGEDVVNSEQGGVVATGGRRQQTYLVVP
jgi:hypothetical protein